MKWMKLTALLPLTFIIGWFYVLFAIILLEVNIQTALFFLLGIPRILISVVYFIGLISSY